MPDLYSYTPPWSVIDSLAGDFSSRTQLRLQYFQRKAALEASAGLHDIDPSRRKSASAPTSPVESATSEKSIDSAISAPAAAAFHEDNKDTDEIYHPLVDVYDFPTSYLIQASIPGVLVSDIVVDFDNRASVLIIAGTVRRHAVNCGFDLSSPLATHARIVSQRQVGRFERSIKLLKNVKVFASEARAKCKDGVLEVVVPKINESESEKYRDCEHVDASETADEFEAE
ncbi:uncharacterized protein V2V93DRAFT_141359 [Kockiozyma suomiensis]|uniref:uncharacterized protein n=1 Tax=Kockiozyma suomiensis TaxID=1337062 RepID=UPI003343D7BA